RIDNKDGSRELEINQSMNQTSGTSIRVLEYGMGEKKKKMKKKKKMMMKKKKKKKKMGPASIDAVSVSPF
ncbi:hypothetical protein LINPERPRIM_LOCUS31241, partial [Linum perenne]